MTVAWLGAEAQTFRPGDVVPEKHLKEKGCEDFFRVQSIPDTIFAMMQGKSYKGNAGKMMPRQQLRYLLCLHRDKDGRAIVGEMVLNKTIAEDVLDIFRQLYEAHYPIERMRLIDYYDADDERSMSDNNSSAFNFRMMTGSTTTISKHGMGMAIDLNTRYNPYMKVQKNGKRIVSPKNGNAYVDRTVQFPYKIVKGDLCYRLFTAKGFKWGGSWKSVKDWQHFEK